MPNINQMYPQMPAERERLDNMIQQVQPQQVMPGRPATATEPAKLTRPILSTTKQPVPAATEKLEPLDVQENFNAPSSAPQPQPTAVTNPAVLPVTKSTTRTESTNLKPADSAALAKAQTELDNARTANLLVQKDAAEATANAQMAHANKLNQEAELLRIEQERIAQLREANRERYLNKISEYEGMKIENPWANMSTGSKIMAGISIALGGLAGENGRNSALEIINSNIARDIDIQKANMDKKKGELTAIQQYGQELRQMGMDDITVREAMIGMGKQQLASQLDALKTRIGEKDPRYPQVVALQQKYAEEALNEKMKIAELGASKTATISEQDFIKVDSTTTKIPDSVKQQLADIETTKQKLKGLEEAKRNVDTGPIMAALKEAGKVVGYESTVAVPFEANINDVVASYARGMEGGRMTDQDIERYKEIMPRFLDNDKQFKIKLQEAKNRLRMQEEALRQQYGLPMPKESQIEKQKQGLK